VLRHAAGDQVGYAAAITGGPWPTEDPFAPTAAAPEDPDQFLDQALNATAAAYAGVADNAESVPVPLPTGPFPAWIAAGACALDAAIHAWDIAVATGQPSPLTDELAKSLRPVADQIVEPLRAFAFAPVIDDPASTGDAAELLKYLGRRPNWPA
jgi:uncharacterized protein (TIGR03086 family)